MKTYIKVIIIILVLGLGLVIFNKYKKSNEEYYLHVADTVVSMYSTNKYDRTSIKKRDYDAFDKFLSTLTHINEEICVSDYIIKKPAYRTGEKNSKIIYKKDNKCYVLYEDLSLAYKDVNDDIEIEPYDKLICDGYVVYLYKSMFMPAYEDTLNNPKYNYFLEDYLKTDTGYEYNYVSSYDGSKIKVILEINNVNKITKIKVEDRES